MAKLKKIKNEVSYKITLSQKEADVLGGLIADLGDPARGVEIGYMKDYSRVRLSPKGQAIMNKLSSDLHGMITETSDNYDYYDYWEEIDDEN